ncbi:MAG: hypothetical protein ACYCSN_19400 [Acidobacteriaceae bacterium]
MANNLENRIAKLETEARRTGAADEEKSYAIWHALAAQKGGTTVVRQFVRAAKAKDRRVAFEILLADNETKNRLLRAAQTVREGGVAHAE